MRIRLAVALGLVVISGMCLQACDRRDARSRTQVGLRPGSGAGTQVTLQVPSGADHEAKLRGAILSVHAYVEEHRLRANRVSLLGTTLSNTLQAIPRMPLMEAAELIQAAQDESANLRIQRMVVRLLAHTRERPDTIAAVRKMIGPQATSDIVAKTDAALETNPALLPEQVVVENYALVMGPQPYRHCDDWKAWSDDDMGAANDVSIVVTAEAKPSSFANLRKGLDPQSWGPCSVLWKEAHLAKMLNGQPVVGPDGNPVREPQTVGDPWGDKTLYEQFVCDDAVIPSPCDIRLLLDVRAVNPAADTYYVRYERPRHFPHDPGDPDDVWVVTDHGSVKATKQGARADLKSSKTFGFTNKVHTLMVLAWLYAIEEQSYLGELACCF